MMADVIKADVKGTGSRVTNMKAEGSGDNYKAGARAVALELAIVSVENSGTPLNPTQTDALVARAEKFYGFIAGTKAT
jgi:hypothetical protein